MSSELTRVSAKIFLYTKNYRAKPKMHCNEAYAKASYFCALSFCPSLCKILIKEKLLFSAAFQLLLFSTTVL